ncbi:MAG: hypothetical protein LBN07_02475 [Christensenellaceae bacterium]|jgi:uncharacterized membrane protein|nr:hypothetical protein [Christensenellaceae bacterium]
MKSTLKYGVTITIAAMAVSIVQFVCGFLGFDIDVNILIDIASVIMAVLVVLGVVKRAETIDTDELKGQIKDDLKDKLDGFTKDETGEKASEKNQDHDEQ